MSKLDELDKEFDEKFPDNEVDGWIEATNGQVKSFARRYYDLGKLEEREVLKKMVEGMGIEEGMSNESGELIDPEILMQIKHDTDYVRMGYEAAKKEIKEYLLSYLNNPQGIK